MGEFLHGQRTEIARKRLKVAAGVGASVAVVLVLYGLSFRYQNAEPSAEDLPRWGELKGDVSKAMNSLIGDAGAIAKVKESLRVVAGAQAVQAKSIAIMKEKIADSATTTQ
jgi:hypothetical protein